MDAVKGEQPITAIIRRRVASGCEQEFEDWSKEIAREHSNLIYLN